MPRGPHNTAFRRDWAWRAAMLHRLSGLALACFLPLHFLALGLAIEGEAHLDSFLSWAQSPIVRLSETGLVLLLTLHLLGGLRILAVENLPWRSGQKRMVAIIAALSLMVAALFLFGAYT